MPRRDRCHRHEAAHARHGCRQHTARALERSHDQLSEAPQQRHRNLPSGDAASRRMSRRKTRQARRGQARPGEARRDDMAVTPFDRFDESPFCDRCASHASHASAPSCEARPRMHAAFPRSLAGPPTPAPNLSDAATSTGSRGRRPRDKRRPAASSSRDGGCPIHWTPIPPYSTAPVAKLLLALQSIRITRASDRAAYTRVACRRARPAVRRGRIGRRSGRRHTRCLRPTSR